LTQISLITQISADYFLAQKTNGGISTLNFDTFLGARSRLEQARCLVVTRFNVKANLR
jgi:hypothetical protein